MNEVTTTKSREELKLEASALWKRGWNLSQIVVELGLPRGTVSTWTFKDRELFPLRTKTFKNKIARSNSSRFKEMTFKATIFRSTKGLGRVTSIEEMIEKKNKRVEEVRLLHVQGFTMLQIADKLGMSRSAVAGLMTRNRDVFPLTKAASTKPKVRAKIAAEERHNRENATARLLTEIRAMEKDEDTVDAFIHPLSKTTDTFEHNSTIQRVGKGLVELEDDECRWPVGQDDDVAGKTLFCGHRVHGKLRYCASHAKTSAPIAIS